MLLVLLVMPAAAGAPGGGPPHLHPPSGPFAAAPPSGCPRSGPAPKIVPPDKESYLGLGYGEWAALWWQWAWSIPDGPAHPFNCTASADDLLQNQAGHVWFLAGTFGSCSRSLTIPAGTALFFPVGNGECSTLEGPCPAGPGCYYGSDAPSLSACAALHGDEVQQSSPTCTIDGKPVAHLDKYRVQTPMFSFGPLPSPPIFGVPDTGGTGLSVDAGTYLLLEPLDVGQHEVRFTSYNPNGIDTTYCLTVVPQ